MMTVTEFTSLSKNYDALNEEQRLALEKITYRYPYFQAAYALYLKSLKEQEKFNFDLEFWISMEKHLAPLPS